MMRALGGALLCSFVSGGEYRASMPQRLACATERDFANLQSWVRTVCCEHESEECGEGDSGLPTCPSAQQVGAECRGGACRSGACQRAAARVQSDCANFFARNAGTNGGIWHQQFAPAADLCEAAAAASPAWAPPAIAITDSGGSLPRCGGLLFDGLGTHGASGLDRITLPAPPDGQQLQFRVRSLYLEDRNSVTIQDRAGDHFYGPALSGHTTADWRTIDAPPGQEIDVVLNV